jgi:hypothetical protein
LAGGHPESIGDGGRGFYTYFVQCKIFSWLERNTPLGRVAAKCEHFARQHTFGMACANSASRGEQRKSELGRTTSTYKFGWHLLLQTSQNPRLSATAKFSTELEQFWKLSPIKCCFGGAFILYRPLVFLRLKRFKCPKLANQAPQAPAFRRKF